MKTLIIRHSRIETLLLSSPDSLDMGSTMSVSKKKSFPTSSGFNQAWTISLEEIVGVTSQWFPWLTIIWYVITTFHKQRKFMIIYVCFFLWARWVQRCANPWDIVVLVRIASHHQGITRYHASSFSHRAQSPNMLPPGCLFEWGNNDERSNIGFKLYTSVSPIFKQTHWSSCIILLKISIYIYIPGNPQWYLQLLRNPYLIICRALPGPPVVCDTSAPWVSRLHRPRRCSRSPGEPRGSSAADLPRPRPRASWKFDM